MLSESHVAGLPYLSVSLNDPQYALRPVVTHILAGSPYSTDAATFGGIVKNLYDEHNNCYEVRTLEDVERFLRSCEPVVVEFVSGRRIGTSLALLSEFEKGIEDRDLQRGIHTTGLGMLDVMIILPCHGLKMTLVLYVVGLT